jgi:glucose-6-phosphate isomerase
MTFDIKRILESKKALRRKLANQPLTEKLTMLDALRERALALREAAESMRHPVVREAPTKYRAARNKNKRSKS